MRPNEARASARTQNRLELLERQHISDHTKKHISTITDVTMLVFYLWILALAHFCGDQHFVTHYAYFPHPCLISGPTYFDLSQRQISEKCELRRGLPGKFRVNPGLAVVRRVTLYDNMPITDNLLWTYEDRS